MANAIKLFTASELKNACDTKGIEVLSPIVAKKDDKNSKAKFFPLKFNIGDHKNAEGWFSVSNIPLSRGVADPKDKTDPRNIHDMRSRLETTVSRAGDWGAAMVSLDAAYRTRVEEAQKAGIISDKFNTIGLVRTEFSEDYQKKNPGKQFLDDPSIGFKIDFEAYSMTHPHTNLRGKQKTQFLDYNTAYTDQDGRIQYKPAMVKIDGMDVPVDKSNMHLFLTAGSIIRSGRVDLGSVCQHKFGISATATMTRCVVEQAGEECFEDELPIKQVVSNVVPVSATITSPKTAVGSVLSASGANNAADAVVNPTDAAADAAADELLNSI